MRVVVLVLCGLVVAVSSLRAQSGKWPIALEALDLEPLAGDLRFAPALLACLPAMRNDWARAGLRRRPSSAGASLERLLRTGPLRAGRVRSMLSHHDRWQLDDLDRDRTW